MKAQLLARAADLARPPPPGAAPAAILAQRHSTLGGGSAAAPPIVDAGRPLEPATRGEMERGFGRDFGAIRVHDDARAHDNARALGALAYAAGDNIVFGEGQYRPRTGPGRALIAHELAHNVQQGGVQMKADGPIPIGADARLEAEADKAAQAVTGGRTAPSLTRIGAPAVFRATTQVAGLDAQNQDEAGEDFVLSTGAAGKLTDDTGPGAKFVGVRMAKLVVPPKGSGDWVSARYQEMVKSLAYDGRLEGGLFKSDQVSTTGYRDIWTQKYGFASLKKAAEALEKCKTPPEGAVAKDILTSFKSDKVGSCAIDHIVEKQLKGDNDPKNLQFLGAVTNTSAGSKLRAKHSGLAGLIRKEVRRHITGIRIRFASVEVSEAEDGATATDKYTAPSVIIEALMRGGTVDGDEAVKEKVETKPIGLRFEKAKAVAAVRPTGVTAIEGPAAAMIEGIRLVSYQRAGAKSKDKGTDRVNAELAMLKVRPAKDPIVFDAKADAAPAAGAEDTPAANENRELTVPAKPSAQFEYLGLSKGVLTSYSVKDGVFAGAGTITPSISFLGPITISYAPPELKVEAFDAKNLPSIASLIHFTGGNLSLTLTPAFKPKGNLEFDIGPKQKPLLTGDIEATVDGGVFIATGKLKLKPGKIPGIDQLAGTVTYRSDTGWSGSATATSSSLPKSTANASFSFWQIKGGGFKTKAEGGIVTSIRDKAELKLDASWDAETGVSYKGHASIPNPIKGVEKVVLDGTYANGVLTATGTAKIGWQKFKPDLSITYIRKDGDEHGTFSGSAKFDVAIGKATGSIALGFGEKGLTSVDGTLEYQLTDHIRPKLGVKLDEHGKLKLSGKVTIADVELTKKWPAGGGEIPLIKGDFRFTYAPPIPIVDFFLKGSGSIRVVYGVGPVVMGVTFDGSLYPFEENHNIVAHLEGRLSVPAYGGLKGILSVGVGAELLFGAAGAEGSLTVAASIILNTDCTARIDASYSDADGFSFHADAKLKGALNVTLGVDLDIELYTLWGHGPGTHWTYPLASVKKQLGDDLEVTLGKIAYSKGQFSVPDAGKVESNPKTVDPLPMLKQLLSKEESKTVKK